MALEALSSDIYAVVSIPGTTFKYRTRVHKKPSGVTQSIWDFPPFQFSTEERHKLNLVIKIKEVRRMFFDKSLGHIHVPINELFTNVQDGGKVCYQFRPNADTFLRKFGRKSLKPDTQNIQEEDVLDIFMMIGQHDEEKDVELDHSLSKIHKHKEEMSQMAVVSRVVVAVAVVKVEDGNPYLSANIEFVYLCLGPLRSFASLCLVGKSFSTVLQEKQHTDEN
ncbi:SRC2-like protein [Tanacetum coccineum]